MYVFFRLFRNLRMNMFQFFKLLSYLWLHWMARLFEGGQTPVNVRRDTFKGTFPWEVNWLSLNDIINFCHVFLVNLQTFLLFWCFSCYLHLNKWITVVAIDKEMSRSTAYWQKRITYIPSRNWIALNESRKLMLVILEKGKGPCLLFCWRVEQSNRSNIVSSKPAQSSSGFCGEGKKRKKSWQDSTLKPNFVPKWPEGWGGLKPEIIIQTKKY